ncbi:MAG TPA: PAS domain-containing protein [Clostridia bacterium]|nr:PAS domain-containing protein [Clostridia bacterium]
MTGLPIQFLDQAFHRVLFDAMPMPILVVDNDVSILEYNSAAAKLLGQDKAVVLRRRGGEAMHCVHATKTPEGCGHSPACADCVVRNSVRAASRGTQVTRQWAPLEILANGRATKTNLWVSCYPFQYEQHSFILLMLEGLEN